MTFDCYTIHRFLTYARILEPLSKYTTLDRLDSYYKKPDFDYQHVLRFMDFLDKNYDDYLAWLYKQSNSIVERDASVLYYDCTNFNLEKLALSNTRNKLPFAEKRSFCISA